MFKAGGEAINLHQTMEPVQSEAPLDSHAAGGTRWFITMQDVTIERVAEERLRASELRFRQMADNIRDVFFLFDVRNGRVLYVNPAYEEITGRSCASLYADAQAWADGCHPDDRAAVAAHVAAALTSGRIDYEYRILRPDGALRWVQMHGSPVRDAAGTLVRIAGVAEDITRRRGDQESLRTRSARP